MKKYVLTGVLLAFCFNAKAIEYPAVSKTLKNGLKVIVCQKPGNNFVYLQVWYRAGSKDEAPGVHGMAHMFEHMMFRGTEKYPGQSFFHNVEKVGGQLNASTHSDFTEYHEYIPKSALDLCMDMEADRMANLKVTQDILNTERQVVGEEFRDGMNNWEERMMLNEYKALYPENDPYTVNPIGSLEEITSFTADECMDFYNKYYSPNYAFVVVVGDVNPDDVFAMADKYFGTVTKQLSLKDKTDLPDLTKSKPKVTEMPLDQMIQVYSYVIPYPAVSSKDYYALNMLTGVLFLDQNSILNNILVKKKHLVYGIASTEETRFYKYPSEQSFDFFMSATPGNFKVKKIVSDEISDIAANGISQAMIDNYIKSKEAENMQLNYSAEGISNTLGASELYYGDYNEAYHAIDKYRKVTPDDIKRVAATYLAPDRINIINIKPD